ncbi:Abhydrolase-2 domain-containing protein [Aphelenchoides besseyi]|nr:Abhydrolase-2 domain-containing protein [Aphelenchoides besseyi]
MSVIGRSPFETSAHGEHKGTIIFLHGLGDQGDGWSQILSRILNKQHMKVICPNAGTRPVTLNFGMQMPAWYDLKGLSPSAAEDVEGINAATSYVHSLIKKEIDAGINPKQIAVGGFSMGGALAIHAALTYPERIGSVVGLSSFLLQRDAIEAACTKNKDIPVFLGHGTNDMLVPLTFGQLTADKIKQFNPNVEFHTYPVDHSTSEKEIADVADFLKKHLTLMSKLNSLACSMIVVVGGCAQALERNCHNSIEISDGRENFKPIETKMIEPRRSPVLISRNNHTIIVAGGCKDEKQHLNSAEILDVDLQNIHDAQFCLPYEFSCAAYCQLTNGSTLIFGGYNGVDCLKEVIKISGNRVETMKPLGTRLKNSAAVCVSDDQVLLFGGWDEKNTLKTVFSYQSDGTQEFYSLLPSPIEGHTATRHEDSVYVVGGFDGLSVVNTIIRYDLKTRKAETVGKLEIARENHATVTYEQNGHFYILVIGGWNGRSALAHCELFRLLSSAPWIERIKSTLFELNEPRNRPAAIVLS